MMSGDNIYLVLLLGGLLGSLGHCLGMCGPLVVMVSTGFKSHGIAVLPGQLLYHAARTTVYALLGAVMGALGAVLGVGGTGSVPGLLSVALGALVIAFGLSYLGWLPLGRIEGGGSWLTGAMGRAIRRGGLASAALLGGLNGLLPCGLVYSALLIAASTGGPLRGAAAMAVFGAGTLPAMLVAGLGAGQLSAGARQALSRAAGVLIMLVGVQLALRGLAALGVVGHLAVGGMMVW
jgi:sulfite exporter TauE/SafE